MGQWRLNLHVAANTKTKTTPKNTLIRAVFTKGSIATSPYLTQGRIESLHLECVYFPPVGLFQSS